MNINEINQIRQNAGLPLLENTQPETDTVTEVTMDVPKTKISDFAIGEVIVYRGRTYNILGDTLVAKGKSASYKSQLGNVFLGVVDGKPAIISAAKNALAEKL